MADEREQLVVNYTRRGWRFDARWGDLEVKSLPSRDAAEQAITKAIREHFKVKNPDDLLFVHLATVEAEP